MKTEIICPNKNDPSWKPLVKAIGEVRSYVAFFRTGNVIPDPTTARLLLKIKPAVGAKLTSPAPPVEPGTPVIRLRPADTRSIKAGIVAAPHGGRPVSHPRRQLQTHHVFKASAKVSI
jgi:hypothetical protein